MTLYRHGFDLDTVYAQHKAFEDGIRLCQRIDRARRRARQGPTGATAAMLRAYSRWQRGLDDIAKASALDAQQAVQRALKSSAKRPDTGIGGPHIHDLIRCRPVKHAFPTGEVGIGDIAFLDRAVDPDYEDAGPYWRAQEFGTTAHVGRSIYGYFYGAGWSSPAVPSTGQSGQPLFSPRRGGVRGGKGGKGTIRRPIMARHFLRDGMRAAEGPWLAAIARSEARGIADYRAAAALALGGGGGFGSGRRSPRR